MFAAILLILVIIGCIFGFFTLRKVRKAEKALRDSLIASLITPLREYENAGVYAGTAMKRGDHDTVEAILENLKVSLNAEPSQAHHSLAHSAYMAEYYKAWGVERKTTEEGAKAFLAQYGRNQSTR